MLQILSFLETPDKEEPDPFPGVPRWQITVSGLHLLCIGWWEGIVSYEGNTLNFAGVKNHLNWFKLNSIVHKKKTKAMLISSTESRQIPPFKVNLHRRLWKAQGG